MTGGPTWLDWWPLYLVIVFTLVGLTTAIVYVSTERYEPDPDDPYERARAAEQAAGSDEDNEEK